MLDVPTRLHRQSLSVSSSFLDTMSQGSTVAPFQTYWGHPLRPPQATALPSQCPLHSRQMRVDLSSYPDNGSCFTMI